MPLGKLWNMWRTAPFHYRTKLPDAAETMFTLSFLFCASRVHQPESKDCLLFERQFWTNLSPVNLLRWRHKCTTHAQSHHWRHWRTATSSLRRWSQKKRFQRVIRRIEESFRNPDTGTAPFDLHREVNSITFVFKKHLDPLYVTRIDGVTGICVRIVSYPKSRLTSVS